MRAAQVVHRVNMELVVGCTIVRPAQEAVEAVEAVEDQEELPEQARQAY